MKLKWDSVRDAHSDKDADKKTWCRGQNDCHNKRTCSISSGGLAGSVWLANALHFPEADSTAYASLNAPQRTSSAARFFVRSNSLGSWVDHRFLGLGLGPGGEGQILEEVLTLSSKLDEGLVEVKVSHQRPTAFSHKCTSQPAIDACTAVSIGMGLGVGRSDGGAASVAGGTAIEFVEGREGESWLYRNLGETVPRALSRMPRGRSGCSIAIGGAVCVCVCGGTTRRLAILVDGEAELSARLRGIFVGDVL